MPKGRSRSNKPRKFPSFIAKSSQVKRKYSDLHSVKAHRQDVASCGVSYSTDRTNDRCKMDLDLDSCDYPCGICMKPVNDNDEAILCDSGNYILNPAT